MGEAAAGDDERANSSLSKDMLSNSRRGNDWVRATVLLIGSHTATRSLRY